jgi:hypothetical protein
MFHPCRSSGMLVAWISSRTIELTDEHNVPLKLGVSLECARWYKDAGTWEWPCQPYQPIGQTPKADWAALTNGAGIKTNWLYVGVAYAVHDAQMAGMRTCVLRLSHHSLAVLTSQYNCVYSGISLEASGPTWDGIWRSHLMECRHVSHDKERGCRLHHRRLSSYLQIAWI